MIRRNYSFTCCLFTLFIYQANKANDGGSDKQIHWTLQDD